MKVNYYQFKSKKQQAEIESLVKTFYKLIPKNLLTLHIYYWDSYSEDESIPCSAQTNFKYHSGTINIYSPFFSTPDDLKPHKFLHEMIHLHMAGYTELFQEVVLYVKSHNKDLYIFLEREYEKIDEMFTEQISEVLCENVLEK